MDHKDVIIQDLKAENKKLTEELEKFKEGNLDPIEMCKVKIALDRLKEYKQLEEQGLLLKLPCKVGTTLFFLKSNEHADRPTKSIIYETNQWKYCVDELGGYISMYSIPIGFHGNYRHVLGKTVFLTEQEAQSALEKMKGE